MKLPQNHPRKVWLRPIAPSSIQDNQVFTDNEDKNSNCSEKVRTDTIETPEDDYEGDEEPKAAFKYKKVAQKVRPIAAIIPEHLKPKRQFPEDPLRNLPALPYHPPDFIPTTRITAERMEELKIHNHEELWPEERKLLQHVIRINERSIAFDENERGTFRSDYFSDYIIPTAEHEPWIEKNIPLPQGRKNEIIQVLKEKIKAGVYESANSSYRSRWFSVAKKDKGIRLVHDLQKLNSVTIRDSAVPPIIEEFVEEYAGRSIYTVLDMYWGFHARMLDPSSRDLTAFQTPLGAYRLTSLPMGFANSPAEFQACMMFILQDEVPNKAGVFIDDVPIKGPATRYLDSSGKEEVLQQNPGIRRYVWEHLNDVHRILHRLGEAGGTVSGKKMQLCKSEVEIVGHQCSTKGREPVDTRVKKILNWPTPTNLKEVRGFVGLCGTVRIWIKDFSQITRPLVELSKKGVPFHWNEEQEQAFNKLKELVTQAPAIRPIDYTSEHPLILSVDTSIHGIGFILSQEDEQGRRIPARYGSLPLTPTQQQYGQTKLELYGLFRALRRFRSHITGVSKLIVETDASGIIGMLKKPEELPSPIDRWATGILQFPFKLVHVPAYQHKGPDALSRRRYTSEDDGTHQSDPEEWVDNVALAAKIEDSEESPPSDTTTGLESSSSRQFIQDLLFPIINDNTFQEHPFKITYTANTAHQYTDQDLTDILIYRVKGITPKLPTRKLQKLFYSKAKPFYLKEAHMYKQRPGHPPQVVIFSPTRRQEILWEMHEEAGHHGIWAVEQQVTLRYFWPGMRNQIKQHVQSCHTCQLRSTKKMHIPITISHPPCLFSKVYLDVMKMPKSTYKKKEWLIGCRDDLSGITECKAITRDLAKVIARFFLKRIILRYGNVLEVVTDNGPSFSKEFAELLQRYGIRHIKISPYNSQANGVVERGHYNIREALVKLCEGNLSKWPLMVPAATYADRITVRRATGFSPYFLLHGVHPFMPGDMTDATFQVVGYAPGMSSQELIMARTRQLLRLPEDIAKARETLHQSRSQAKQSYEQKFSRRLLETPHTPGSLVLIRNNPIENSVSIERKTANRYMGPYQIIRQTQGGSYILAEMDGSLLKHHVAAYRLIPYTQRQPQSGNIPEVEVTGTEETGTELPSELSDHDSLHDTED